MVTRSNGAAVFLTNGVPFPSRFLIVRRPFYGTEFETFFCLLLYVCVYVYVDGSVYS